MECHPAARDPLDAAETTGHIPGVPRPGLREQLLAAGLATFHERGFNATSVQDITDAAGAPKGSFYNHFESKEALAAEAVRRYAERGRKRFALLREDKLPPLRRLRRYFEGLIEAVVSAGFTHGCLLGNFGAELSSQSSVVRQRVGEAFAGWTDALAEVIAEAQKAGEVSGGVSAKALAEFVLHAWEGALVRARVEKDRGPLDTFVKVAFSRILA